MRKFKYVAGLAVLLGGMATTANAQLPPGWYQQCFDMTLPDPDNVHYQGFVMQWIATDLIGASAGVAGTVQYGSIRGPCYIPGIVYDAAGRMSFWVGLNGSIQTPFDDGLALTFGAPVDPAGDFSYMIMLKDDNDPANGALFGDGGLHTAWIGASRRYMVHGWSDADIDVIRTIRLIGDAARIQWDIRNLGEEPRPLGMMFATAVGMLTSFGQFDSQTGSTQAHTLLRTNWGIPKLTQDNFIGYSLFPTGKPFRLEHRYSINSPRFPEFVQFLFGQTETSGLRIDNIPSSDYEKDPIAAAVDLFLVGNYGVGVSPGLIWDNVIRDHVFTDPPGGTSETGDIFIVSTAFVQRFPVKTVQPGAILSMSHYMRSAWSVSSYFDPYTAMIDAPKVLNSDPNGQDGLTPNPFRVRAYVDNQYADVDREIAMRDVTFTITLGDGFSLVAGEQQQVTLDRIDANEMGFVEWLVESDGVTFGSIPVTVTFQPLPGPAKQLTANVVVAATPRIRLPELASMITFPYDFPDNSFESILGLQPVVDFLAFRWDTAQAQYLPASSAQRGEGYWIIPAADNGFIDLLNATRPSDTNQGGLLYSLSQGWNMIGNPYNYPVPLAHLIAVVEDNPANAFTWSELVNNGFVSSALAHWDRGPSGDGPGSYRWTVSQTDVLEPHKAYWVFVTVFQPLRLSWPAVLMPGLDKSGRAEYEKPWNKSDKQWRLQLTARSQEGADTENYVGVVTDPGLRDILQLPKPPILDDAPGVDLVIKGEYHGNEIRLAQALSSSAGKVTWEIFVTTHSAGDVTITWPNLPSIPRGIRAKLTDLATNERRDLRAVSGYTFHMSEPGTRAFTLTLEPGGSSRPVIGNVIVRQGLGRGPGGGPMTISYALSADALVSVRILSATGKVIYTVTRGRADDAGENTVTWALRDNANRAVAPGTYRVEILAETPNGERVRKIVPINVIR